MSMQREYANGDDNTRAQERTGTTRFMRETLLSSRPAENCIFFHIAVDFFLSVAVLFAIQRRQLV